MLCSSIGFRTGIARVRFSHTVPVPAETAPVAGTGTYRPVISTVCYETRGIPFTHGYLYSNISDMYIINSNSLKYMYIHMKPSPSGSVSCVGVKEQLGEG
jgi:hypothetical protein